MKKISAVLLLAAAALVFTYCSSSKKAAAPAAVTKVNYQANVMSIVQANCTPCHFPDKGGRKKPLDTYAAVSSQIDEILRRIQLEPNQRGFMPDRKPNKLSEADIKAFVQWKADGLVEK
jgi:mono/diheme cytochrome c family protein